MNNRENQYKQEQDRCPLLLIAFLPTLSVFGKKKMFLKSKTACYNPNQVSGVDKREGEEITRVALGTGGGFVNGPGT